MKFYENFRKNVSMGYSKGELLESLDFDEPYPTTPEDLILFFVVEKLFKFYIYLIGF